MYKLKKKVSKSEKLQGKYQILLWKSPLLLLLSFLLFSFGG